MRNKQVTAILLSAVMAISICAPMNSMTSFAAENVAEESTESEAKAEVPIEAESTDELEDQENAVEESTESEAEAEVPIEAESTDEFEVQENAAEESTESEAEAEVPIETESTDELEVQEESESVGEDLTAEAAVQDEVSGETEETEKEAALASEEDPGDAEADAEQEAEAALEADTEEAAVTEEEPATEEGKEAKLAGDVVDSGTCGENATWTLTGTDDNLTLTISGSGAMDNYFREVRPWESRCTDIKTIIIEDGIRSIGDSAFEDCTSLTSITIPDSVTNIGKCAFYGCSGLTSITIPDSVTSIGECAFIFCSRLTSITIPDSVTSIGGGAFEQCSRLTSITIPDSVTSIGGSAFANCDNLTSITIPDSVTSIGDCAFERCSSLTSITIPVGVTSIGEGAFKICKSLTSITIPNSVTSIGAGAFEFCSSLTSITIPNSVTSIGACAFERCSSLTSITIPNSVTSIEYLAFSGCSSLTSITIQDGVTSIEGELFAGCTSLTSITIPDSVTRIESRAFWCCSSLTSITIPDSVTYIYYDTGEYSTYNTFAGCEKLSDLYYAGTKKEWDAIEGSSFVYDMNCILHTKDGVYGDVKAQKIALNKSSATIVKGKTLQLKATVTPADATDGKVTWKSGNTNVATVTSTGSIKAVSAGSTTITAVTEGGLKASCTIKVVNPYTIKFDKNVEKKVAAKVTLTTTPKKVNPGDTLGTLPTPEYSGYYFLGWYTDRSGGTKVTPSTKPTKNMTLYAHWVVRKSIKKATVKVGSCMYTGKWCRPSVTVMLGTKKLKNHEDYSISYSNCLDAGSKGVIKITGKGRYKDSISRTFTVSKCSMGEKYISAELSKTTYNYTGKAIKPGITVYLNGRYKLTRGKDYKVTYKNNTEPGKATVQITGMGNFESKSRYFTFTIAKLNQPIKLSRTSLSLRYKNIGTTYDVTATGVKESAGMSVSSSNTSVATVSGSSGKYKIKIKGCGKTNIIFKTNKATKHYKITSIKLPITVADRKMPTISLPQQAYDLDIGDAEFNLMATTDSDGSLTYTSSDVDIVNVDNTGKVTLTGNKEGAVIITITSKATVNYKENTASVSINVTSNRLYWPVRNVNADGTAGSSITGINTHCGEYMSSLDRYHRGIDIAAGETAGWFCPYDGTLEKVYYGCISGGGASNHNNCKPNHGKYDGVCNDGFGNGVVISFVIDGVKYYAQFAHMNEVNPDLMPDENGKSKEGTKISRGTYLGKVGNRGFSFGTHAHFEINKGSQYGTNINNDPTMDGCVFKYSGYKE